MDFDERLLYIVIGVIIGFIAGYWTHALREGNKKLDVIKEEIHEVDEIVKGENPNYPPPTNTERGSISFVNLCAIIVVMITVFAAVQSQRAVNGSHDTQNRQSALISCTASVVEKTIGTLKIRSDFTLNQVDANVDLQRAQSEMIAVLLHDPPFSTQRQVNAFKGYFDALNHFVHAASTSQDTAENNPYPTVDQFNRCIKREIENRKDD